MKILPAAAAFAIMAALPAHADDYAYATANGTSFGVIDLTHGQYTECGQSSDALTGLAVGPDHQLYAAQATGEANTLYQVNPTNGALTAVGVSNVELDDVGSTQKHSLYAVSQPSQDKNSSLYSLDYQTAQASLAGVTGVNLNKHWGVSTSSSQRFLELSHKLFLLNARDGHARLVGTGTEGNFNALVEVHGALFGASDKPFSVYSIDPSTGATTYISTITGAPGDGIIYGLAPIQEKQIAKKDICSAHTIP